MYVSGTIWYCHKNASEIEEKQNEKENETLTEMPG